MYRGSTVSMAIFSSLARSIKSRKFVLQVSIFTSVPQITCFCSRNCSLAILFSIVGPYCKTTYRHFCADPRSGLCLMGVPVTPLLGVSKNKTRRNPWRVHQRRAGKYYVLHNRVLPTSSRPGQPHLQLCYMGRILASLSLTQRWPGSLTCRKESLLLQSLKNSKSTW